MTDTLTARAAPTLDTALAETIAGERPRDAPRGRLRWFLRRPGLILSVLAILIALAWAFAPGLFTSFDPIDGIPADKFQPPSAAHWFGTDALGRDLYARVVYGASSSLTAVGVALLVAFVFGTLIGTLSGFVGGLLDEVLMRVVDVLLSVPGLLVSLILVTALGFGMVNVAIAVGVAAVASFARVMRSEVLRVRTALYVEAAAANGVRWPHVLWRHVLPNSIGPIVVLSTLEFGSAILSISALSFLGFGATRPAPEWGALVSDGRNYLATGWWLTTLPGLIILALVLAANRISRALDRERKERW